MWLLTLFLLLFRLSELSCTQESQPRISIITSVYNGDKFIRGFLEDITRQTIFDQCELILINANSPGNEELIILEYLQKFSNIKYERLQEDPGVYGVWNLAIKRARGKYITNANIDDRRNPDILEIHAYALDKSPKIDLVYSDFLYTDKPNETYEKNTNFALRKVEQFSPKLIKLCLPGPMPMWRRSMHDKCGFFNSTLKYSGDLEFWCRAVSKGCEFKKVNGAVSGLYYYNPKGLSTSFDPAKIKSRQVEDSFVQHAYAPLWKEKLHPLSLLIKFPTRGRTEKFFKTLHEFYQKLSGDLAYHVHVICDSDDATMNRPEIIERLEMYPYLTYSFSRNCSKVEAANRDMHLSDDYDITLLAADDLEPVVDHYDMIIAKRMLSEFPDTDGIINSNDGHAQNSIVITPALGKKFIQRFGFIYHPDYKSLYCNDELTYVARILKKEALIKDILFYHKHPAFGESYWDDLYVRNESFKESDRATFFKRQKNMYDLEKNEIDAATPKMLSILIPTLRERRHLFSRIYEVLQKQIDALGLQDQIEILSFEDERKYTTGYKRNELIRQSNGKYVCFMDDDDLVHEEYIKLIYEACQQDCDCVKLMGIMTVNGKDPQTFSHSLDYGLNYCKENGIYIRPPTHLNPIRRSIALQIDYPNKSYAEDYEWCIKLALRGLLKSEAKIDIPIYYYLYYSEK